MMKTLKLLAGYILLVLPLTGVLAQDATKIDPKHYKVEVENDKVRILRIRYEPGEESKMHSHPQGVAVFLTDHQASMKNADGQSFKMDGKKGDVMWLEKANHQPSNTGDEPFELIQIELKDNQNSSGYKSLHLFELPEGVTEKQISDHLKEMNQALTEEGYGGAGYHLYRIPGNNSLNYQYFLEGVWPDLETYNRVHNSEKWKKIADKGKEMIEKIQNKELYLKAEKVQ